MARATELYTRLLLDAKEFTQGLEKAKRDTLGFGKNLTSTGKAVDSLKGIIGKLSLAVGVAGGAYEAMTKTINSNRDVAEKWKGTVEGGKIVVDQFFSSLASGDWSGFSAGIENAINQGMELERVLISLHDKMTAFSIVEGEARATLEQQKRIIESRTSTSSEKEEARKIYLEEIQKIDKQAQSAEKEARAASRSVFQRYGQVQGVTDEKVYKYMTEYLGGQNEEYNKFERELKTIERKSMGKGLVGNMLASIATQGDPAALERHSQAKSEVKEAREKAPKEFVEWYDIKQRMDQEEVTKVASKIIEAQNIRQRRDAYVNSTKELNQNFDEQGKYIEQKRSAAISNSVKSVQKTIEEVKTPLQLLEEQIKDVTTELSFPTDTTDIDALRDKLKQLQEDKKELEKLIKLRVEGVEDLSIPAIDPLKVPLTPILAQVEMQKVKKQLQEEVKALEKELSVTVSVEKRKQITSQIENKQSDIKVLEASTPDLKVKLPEVKGYNDDIEGLIKNNNSLITSFGMVSDAVGMIGNAFGASGDSVLQWGLNVVTSVTRAVGAMATLIAAKRAEATANASSAVTGAASSVAGIPIAGAAMAVAAAASVIAAFANIPKFAEGGVVGGNSYYGDKILARVNSGELILNNRQQQTIFNQMQQVQAPQPQEGKVEFRIRGQDLEGILTKHKNRVSRS